MSMIGDFLAIDEDKANDLIKNPDSIVDFLYSEEFPVEDTEDFLDIDKSWHGIHFLLTGSEWEGNPPARDVILGGVAYGEDIGYGPARFLNSEEVKNVDAFLSGLDSDHLQSKFNAEELGTNDIYPNNWNTEDCDYLAGYFDDLKAFYKKAAGENKMVIQYLN
jgi:Domain of unknown function (DUF1877)